MGQWIRPVVVSLVGLAFAVPMELQLHASVFIGPDFFTGLADDDCGLGAVNKWFDGGPSRPKRVAAGNAARGRFLAARNPGDYTDGPEW